MNKTRRRKKRRKEKDKARADRSQPIKIEPYRSYPFDSLPRVLQERLRERQLGTGNLKLHQYFIPFPPSFWFKLVGVIVAPLILWGYTELLVNSGRLWPLILIATALVAYVAPILISHFSDWWNEQIRELGEFRVQDGMYITTHYLIHMRRKEITYLPLANETNLRVWPLVHHSPHTGREEIEEYVLDLNIKYKDLKIPASIRVDYAPRNIAGIYAHLVEGAKEDGSYEAQDDLVIANKALMFEWLAELGICKPEM